MVTRRWSGSRARRLRSEILLTHGHHTGSARELARITGAKVRGPALDAGVIEGRARRQDPQLEEWEVPLFEQFGTVAPAPPVKLDDRLEKGSLLAAVGGQREKTRGAAVYLPRNDVDLSSRLIHQIVTRTGLLAAGAGRDGQRRWRDRRRALWRSGGCWRG